MEVTDRARMHAALGSPHRLRIVDALRSSDRTFQELARLIGLPGNAAAHHLAALEAAGVIERHVSEGDHRRRYISLRGGVLDALLPIRPVLPGTVLFVCTHNSARSQFAAARWTQRTGGMASSAGTQPADRVHPMAVESAVAYGIDLSTAVTRSYGSIDSLPELVISVCDRAQEAPMPFDTPRAHWSIPDPVAVGTRRAFATSFAAIADRIDRLAATTAT